MTLWLRRRLLQMEVSTALRCDTHDLSLSDYRSCARSGEGSGDCCQAGRSVQCYMHHVIYTLMCLFFRWSIRSEW